MGQSHLFISLPLSALSAKKYGSLTMPNNTKWDEEVSELWNTKFLEMWSEETYKELEKWFTGQLDKVAKRGYERGAKEMYDNAQEMFKLLKEYKQDTQELKDMLSQRRLLVKQELKENDNEKA